MNGDVTGPLILGYMRNVLNSLEEPEENVTQGIITVTLTWGAQPDVDLHIYEPDGNHVYYASRTGNSGYLDWDDTSSYGPEHYYASCANLQTGTYNVGVNYYYGHGPETARIIINAYDIEREYSVSLSTDRGSSGDNSPIHVASIVVTTDEDGYYKFSVN